MSESPDIMLDESYWNELSAENGENSESINWKINNTDLAKENARLRKEIQKYVTIFKENSIRCTNLEVAWRRRGETLAKVDIISRLAGTQILKLLDTLTELRTACQVDLQTPIEGVAGQLSHLRHSLPSKSEKSGIPINSKSQLVHHVNPMVSGHPIIKPTITLRRLNLNASMRPQEQEEVLEPVEEVDLSASVGQSPESSDEEDVVEVTPGSRRISTTSPNLSYQNIVLPVAEVPLVRLSLSHISERIGSVCSPLNGVQGQNRKIYNARRDMHSGIDCVQSDNQVIEIDSTPVNSSPTSSSSLATNSLRKYPGSRSRLSEDRKSDITTDVEKCRLVVSLKDVGSYLHNGILSGIEQLEEGKVKTGASAQPESKDSPSCINGESQLNAAQDQTELNFSGIGVLNYSAVPVRNDHVEGSSSPSTKEFLSKLQEEDPLEGPSWRYGSVKTSSKRKRHGTQHTSLSSPKEKNQSANSPNTPKKQIPASLKSPSKLSKANHDEVPCADDAQLRGTNLTNCVALSVKTDAVAPPSDCEDKEQTDHSASSCEEPPILEVAEEKSSITKYNKQKKGKVSGVNRKPPSLKKQTDEVAPISDDQNKDKTDNSTTSDDFHGFPASNVSEGNPSITTKKRRKPLNVDSDEDDDDVDYIPPSQRSRNSKRGTIVRKPKGKSVKSSISRKKNVDNTNVVQRKKGSLQATTEVQVDVETNTKNSPNNVTKRRSTSTILIEPTFDRKLRRQSPKIQN